jgi:hypothetical protein
MWYMCVIDKQELLFFCSVVDPILTGLTRSQWLVFRVLTTETPQLRGTRVAITGTTYVVLCIQVLLVMIKDRSFSLLPGRQVFPLNCGVVLVSTHSGTESCEGGMGVLHWAA